MSNLESVKYKKEDGNLIAIEIYKNGSTREVKIKNGVVDYILNGAESCSNKKGCGKKINDKIHAGMYRICGEDGWLCDECSKTSGVKG